MANDDLKLDEAAYQRDVEDTDEADKLRNKIWNALDEYADYLERHGLVWDFKEVEKVMRGEGADYLKADNKRCVASQRTCSA
jgi:hypothetical protein